MWNFATLLPLMIGDKVPETNSKWECYLLLLEITKNCTAKITSSATSDYLRALIEDHHQLFKSCNPDISVTPTRHYMVHFPRQLIKYACLWMITINMFMYFIFTRVGPMVTTWCMRMEAKNSYFKRIAQLGNFVNLPLSVAKRHQRLLCAHLQGKFFLYDDLECGPCKSIINVF